MMDTLNEIDVTQLDTDIMSTEEARAAASTVIPKGSYNGIVELDRVKVVQETREDSPFNGLRRYMLYVNLTMEDTITGDQRTRVFTLFACPSVVKVQSKDGGSFVSGDSKNAGVLYNGTKLGGQPFIKVIERLAEHPHIWNIGVRTDKSGEERNVLYSIVPI